MPHSGPRFRHRPTALALTLLLLSGCQCGRAPSAADHLDTDKDLQSFVSRPVRLAEVLALHGQDAREVDTTTKWRQLKAEGNLGGAAGCGHNPLCALLFIPGLVAVAAGTHDLLVTVEREDRVEFQGLYSEQGEFQQGFWREGDTLHVIRALRLHALQRNLVVEVARGPVGKWPEETPPLERLPPPLEARIIEGYDELLGRKDPSQEPGKLLVEATLAVGDAAIPLAERHLLAMPYPLADYAGFLCSVEGRDATSLPVRAGFISRSASQPHPKVASTVLSSCFSLFEPVGPPEAAKPFVETVVRVACAGDAVPKEDLTTAETTLWSEAHSDTLRPLFAKALQACPSRDRRLALLLKYGHSGVLTDEELDAAFAASRQSAENLLASIDSRDPIGRAAMLRAWRKGHVTAQQVGYRLLLKDYETLKYRREDEEKPPLTEDMLAVAEALLAEHPPTDPSSAAVAIFTLERLLHSGDRKVPPELMARLTAAEKKASHPVSRRRYILAQVALGAWNRVGEAVEGPTPSPRQVDIAYLVQEEDLVSFVLALVESHQKDG